MESEVCRGKKDRKHLYRLQEEEWKDFSYKGRFVTEK